MCKFAKTQKRNRNRGVKQKYITKSYLLFAWLANILMGILLHMAAGHVYVIFIPVHDYENCARYTEKSFSANSNSRTLIYSIL